MSCSSRLAWASTFASVCSALLPAVALARPASPPAPARGASAPASTPAKEAAGQPPAPDASAAARAGVEAGKAEFAQAIEAQRLEQWTSAAAYAWRSLATSTPAAEKWESAQYVLADALAHLGFTQAAAEYFFTVAQRRQSPALTPRALAGLEKLARDHLVAEDQLLRGVLVEAELATVPLDVADFLHYYRAISDLRLGYEEWAKRDLGAIRPDGHYGHLARIASAISDLRGGKVQETLAAVEKILAEDSDPTVQARASLTRARLLFELGRNEEAIEQFRKVPRTDLVPAGEILLERAWTHYRAGQYHDAMGLLYALGAPSHRALFLPDQFILRGLIYQRFCHFRAAKAAVTDFRARYGPAIAALKAGEALGRVPAVVAAAESLPEVAPAARIRRAVLDETARLGRVGVGDDGLEEHLAGVYDLLQRRADRALKMAMDEGSRVAAERLLEASEQANLLEYEVGVSIHRRVSDAAGRVRLRARSVAVPAGGDEVYYPFDDEYWTDELPDMRFLIQDRCVE